MLEVGMGFHSELTGRDNTYLNGAILGMRKREIDRQFDEIIAFAEIDKFIDTPVKRYPSGMYARLAFAVAAHLEPEVLIVDEVLAVRDAAFRKKCLEKVKDVSGEAINTVTPGESVEIRVRVKANYPLSTAGLGLGISNLAGQRIVTLNTSYQVESAISFKESCDFAATWESSFLCPGTYLLVVAVSNHGETVACWPNAVTFMVAPSDYYRPGKMPDSNYQGYVLADAKWNIEADYAH